MTVKEFLESVRQSPNPVLAAATVANMMSVLDANAKRTCSALASDLRAAMIIQTEENLKTKRIR